MSPPPPDDDAVAPSLDRRLLARLAGFVRPHLALALGAIALLAVEGGLQLVGPWLTQRVIDEAIPARDTAFIRSAALLFAGALALQFVCSWGETMLTGRLGQNVMRDLRRALFDRLQTLSVGYFDKHPAGRLITRVTGDVESLNELFTAGVVAGLGDLFALAAIAVMMWLVDWRLALAAFAVVPFVWLVSRLFQRKVRGAYREIRGRIARINGYLQERIGGLRVVQPRPRKPGVRGATIVFEDVWFAYDALPPADGSPPPPRSADAPEPHWVLRGVSFTVRPGETLALVGHTGAGKSTIVALLLRFHDPQRGRILLDGVDLRALALDEVRGRIGYVQQDIFLFAGDVAGNIRLSSALSDAEVAAAAARVGADRIVARLPQGWAQELGERGASLSVGERQLLSFARALAADPDLLLLDEATSAVDSAREAEIQRALSTLMAGRTTIAVAHRLSTIVDADEILLLHHGAVVERGRHAELVAREGRYTRLWRLQVGVDAPAPVAPPATLAGLRSGA